MRGPAVESGPEEVRDVLRPPLQSSYLPVVDLVYRGSDCARRERHDRDLSTNVVDPAGTRWHFEPNSADTGYWLTSWHEIVSTTMPGRIDNAYAYTRVWNGASWQNETEHNPGSLHCIDTYLNFDAFRNRFVLVCLDFPIGWHSVYYRYSTNPQGTSWGPWKLACGQSRPAARRHVGLSFDRRELGRQARHRYFEA